MLRKESEKHILFFFFSSFFNNATYVTIQMMLHNTCSTVCIGITQELHTSDGITQIKSCCVKLYLQEIKRDTCMERERERGVEVCVCVCVCGGGEGH